MQHRHAATWKPNYDSITQSISSNLSANDSHKVWSSLSQQRSCQDPVLLRTLMGQYLLACQPVSSFFSLPFRHLTTFIHATAVLWYRLEGRRGRKALSCYLIVSISSIHLSKMIPHKETYPCLQGLQNSDINLPATLIAHTPKPQNRQRYCVFPKYSDTGSKHFTYSQKELLTYWRKKENKTKPRQTPPPKQTTTKTPTPQPNKNKQTNK